MKKRWIGAFLAAVMTAAAIAGCGGSTAAPAAEKEEETEAVSQAEEESAEEAEEVAAENTQSAEEPVEIQVFIAASLFFSAAQKQMNALEEDGLIVEGTRANVLNNQVVVIKRKDTESEVTGLADIGKASSLALADGSVPVGKYTRQALMNLGILAETEDPSVYTTQEVSDALGGVEISEQGNVSQVLTAVLEGSCEAGTTYLSDTYGYEDDLDIIETVSYDLTGNVIYPVCQVVNDEADEAETAAAADFVSFITSDEAKAIFDAYLFDTNVE